MTVFNTLLPFVSSAVSLAFAIAVFVRYLGHRGHSHLLVWTIGLLMYGMGGFCEGWNGAFGWSPLVFRLWYLFGAMLVAAWLGQGTVYLLAKPLAGHISLAILVVASVYGTVCIFSAGLDPSLMLKGELSGHAIAKAGNALASPRLLTPFFNIYGTITLVGGAVYSAFIFFRKKVLADRAIGNVLIAVGSMLPAFGGTFSRFGFASALYVSELLGVVIIFMGFLRCVAPRVKDGGKARQA
jgi:hypothetical protein